MRRILVTGAGGQLGRAVVRVISENGDTPIPLDHDSLDITDPNAVDTAFASSQPDFVIHCAAWTNVDGAEDDPEGCYAVNAEGTRNIVSACSAANIPLIYVSTDYVFDGSGERPWAPSDETTPLSTYGASKLEGEKAVRQYPKHFIVRTSWVYGEGGKNFVNTMIRLSEGDRQVNVVSDQYGSPTYTADLALLLYRMSKTDRYGTYHAHNEGYCSWYEFAREIFLLAGSSKIPLPIDTVSYPTKAKRPLNGRLDTDCLSNAGFEKLPGWKEALRRYFKSICEAE